MMSAEERATGSPPSEVAELEERLAYAEGVLRAIRRGEIDGVVTGPSGAERVYSLKGAEVVYRLLVERMGEGAATIDADGTVLYANHRLAELAGQPLGRVLGRDIADLIASGAERLMALTGNATLEAELELTGPAGAAPTPVYVSAAALPEDSTGAVCLIVTDLSAIRQREESLNQTNRELREERAKLQESNHRFRTVFDNGPLAMAIVDAGGRYVAANPMMAQMLGRPLAEIEGLHFGELTAADDRGAEADRFGRVAAGESDGFHLEKRYVTDHGSVVWASMSVGAVRGDDGKLLYCLEMAQDVSERQRAEDQLRHLANHDALTGLLNRRGLEQELTRQIDLQRRYGHAGALMLLDIDNLKDVNDSLGHQAGDRLIRHVGAALATRLRHSDVLARLGGDEFVALIPFASADDAAEAADALRNSVRDASLTLSGKPVRPTVSIGVRLMDGTVGSSTDALAEADLALYVAKEGGRDRISMYEPTAGHRNRAAERVRVTGVVQEALERDRFELHAQPVVALQPGCAGFDELLLRLPANGAGGLMPDAFLPIAERAGQLQEIDRWVLRRTVGLLAEREGIRLAANVSGASLADPTLLVDLATWLKDAGVDPARLVIELSESSAAADVESGAQFMRSLRAMGCQCALDDFGTGFSSFAYLKHLPLDYLKLDGSFIQGLAESHADQLIVAAVTDVAHGLGGLVVAEWVESGRTLERLRELGVDLAQGFHLGRPGPLPLAPGPAAAGG